jgi:hypothetical protein
MELDDGDYVVFIPDKDMWAIDRAILRMEYARKELHRIRDSLRPPADPGETDEKTP